MFKNKKIKIGLALGGGGARGFTHVGVIRAFQEFGLEFDYIAGTSAGSVVGACYANDMDWNHLYELAKGIKEKDIMTNKIPLVPSKTDGIEALMIKSLGNINIEDLKRPFSAIAVDLKTTKEVCISHGNLAKAVAGSCAVPGVFVPVQFEDCLLSDGGLQNTIPADIPRLFGCDYVVAVDCNKERTYGTNSQKIIDVITCTIRILMKGNAVKGYVNSDIVIKPDTKRFKAYKTAGMEEMIDEGYNAAIDMMPQITELFKRKKMIRKKKVITDKEEIKFI